MPKYAFGIIPLNEYKTLLFQIYSTFCFEDTQHIIYKSPKALKVDFDFSIVALENSSIHKTLTLKSKKIILSIGADHLFDILTLGADIFDK